MKNLLDVIVTGLAVPGAPLDRVANGRIHTGDYGRAVLGGLLTLYVVGCGLALGGLVGGASSSAWLTGIGLALMVVSAVLAGLFVLRRQGPGSWKGTPGQSRGRPCSSPFRSWSRPRCG